MFATLPVSNKRQLGAMLFHPGVHKADENWRESDAKVFEKHLNPILGKDTTNGQS
jgi:hypothetical protein